MTKITKVLVEIDGKELKDIRDLNPDLYEEFLEKMYIVYFAYKSLNKGRNAKSPTDK